MTVAPIFGLLAFSLQIYFDFAGYTDIARGCAALLATVSSELRAALSGDRHRAFCSAGTFPLSTWLRDYLYIRLAEQAVHGAHLSQSDDRHGSRRLMARRELEFLIWGLYHGALLVAHRLWRHVLRLTRLDAVVDRPMLVPL